MNGHSCVFGCLYPLNQIEFRKTILLIPLAFATKNNLISQYIENIINLISAYTTLIDFSIKRLLIVFSIILFIIFISERL